MGGEHELLGVFVPVSGESGHGVDFDVDFWGNEADEFLAVGFDVLGDGFAGVCVVDGGGEGGFGGGLDGVEAESVEEVLVAGEDEFAVLAGYGGTYEHGCVDVVACKVAVVIVDWVDWGAVIDGFRGILSSIGDGAEFCAVVGILGLTESVSDGGVDFVGDILECVCLVECYGGRFAVALSDCDLLRF